MSFPSLAGRSRLLLTVLSLATGVASAAPDVFVAYPDPNYRVAYPNVILEGSVTPGASLTVNGQRVNVGPDGLFMEYWPLRGGVNTLKLVATLAGQTGVKTIRVTRTVEPTLPAAPTAIVRTSVTPRENIEFWDVTRDTPAERRVQVSFRGSPGGKAVFRVGGGAPQAMREGPSGFYSGVAQISDRASFLNVSVDVTLTGRDGKTVKATAPGRLTSTLGAIKSGTQKAGSIRGLGINDAENSVTTLDGQPILYPRNGMTFQLVGRQGQDVRARLAPGFSVLIRARQLSLLAGAPALAQAGVSTTDRATLATGLPSQRGTLAGGVSNGVGNVPQEVPVPATPAPSLTDGGGEAEAGEAVTPAEPPATAELPAINPVNPVLPTPAIPPALEPPALTPEAVIRIPLGGAKIPFQLRQTGPNQVQVALYGLLISPGAAAPTDPLVRNISVVPGSGMATVTIDLNLNQLWGFTANFEGTDLVVRVRRPPSLDTARPVLGRVITIDPGHGGTQKGGAGSLRVPEKNLVLPIALRVAELLRAQGAVVNLTRMRDVTLGLYERDLSAEQAGSDLLVSIHANALPDGRNPRGIRGPEVFFTHPQAQPVAQVILEQVRQQLPNLEAGRGLMPDANLALTRPTTQISLLVETAYLTDPGNLRTLMSPDGRERFAQAITQGIVNFYRSQLRE